MKTKIMNPFKRITLAFLLAGVLPACGGSGDGGGGGGGGTSSTATVSSYVTDDLGGYDTVEMTINTVQLRHTSGRNCEIIKGPLTIDAAELGHDELLENVDTTVCEAGSYNRLHVELAEDVKLVHEVNGQPQTNTCKFVSYYEDNKATPNRLACTNGICSLDINGAVNLVAGNHEHVALDADLKEFTVDGSKTPCEVTLKVSPLHAQGFEDKMAAGYRKAISGIVSSLDTTLDTFRLTHNGRTYLVQYAAVADQPGIDALLTRAASDALRTRVRCTSLNEGTTPPTCTATSDVGKPLKAITVQVEGTVSQLGVDTVTPLSFVLAYGNGKSIAVNYTQASNDGKVEGTLANDAIAEAKLYGFNLDYFLAREVEVETN